MGAQTQRERESGAQTVGVGTPRARPALPLRERDPSDPGWRAVELAQRGRMILEVTAADLEAAEAAYGAFHPTTWHFRNAWYEAQRSWDRLRAELGGAKLDAALEELPLTVLALGPGGDAFAPDLAGRWPLPCPTKTTARNSASALLILIGGQTYQAQRIEGTALAPLIWRLTRLHPPLENGPYYSCRLADGSTQCDCAEWTYRIAETDRPDLRCKPLASLEGLGWL